MSKNTLAIKLTYMAIKIHSRPSIHSIISCCIPKFLSGHYGYILPALKQDILFSKVNTLYIYNI